MKSLQLYSYRPDTGELVGSFLADPDPEAGGFLVPWGATPDVPPTAGDKEVAVYRNNKWSLVADHRGETWYDPTGTAVVVERPGDPSAFDPPLSATAPEGPPSEMSALRQRAFDAAMGYGNSITAKVTGAYADVEVQSWTAQEAEARTVLAGGTLIGHALLPPLAEDKGVSLQAYAESVIEKADAYRQIAVAAVRLRRGAEGLLSESLDTPEKLDAAVEALRAQTLAAAEALGIEV